MKGTKIFISVELHSVGIQTGTWECGYFAVYWHLVLRLLISKGCRPPLHVRDLPPPPKGWKRLLSLLLGVKEKQTNQLNATPMDLRLAPLFKRTQEIGVFTLASFIEALDKYRL